MITRMIWLIVSCSIVLAHTCFALPLPAVTRVLYPFTSIDTAGFFQLKANVSDQITINASNVTLDLNGQKIGNGVHGIVINQGLSNITIQNGTIAGVALHGVDIQSGCSDIVLNRLIISDAIVGINAQEVTGLCVMGCQMNMSNTGIECFQCQNVMLTGCVASSNKYAGYSFVETGTSYVQGCTANLTGFNNNDLTNTSVRGFVSQHGFGNVFNQCIAQSTSAVAQDMSLVAAFALLGSETSSSIGNATVVSVNSSLSGDTVPYGIYIQDDLIVPTASLASALGTAGDVNEVAWSPNGHYLAVVGAGLTGGANNNLQVLKFNKDNNTLQVIAGAGGTTNAHMSIDWSECGTFLLVTVNQATLQRIDVYSFNAAMESLSLLNSLDVSSDYTTLHTGRWSPDGYYFAVGVLTIPEGMAIYSFNKVTYDISLVVNYNGAFAICSLDWGIENYIVFGTDASGSSQPYIGIAFFNKADETISTIALFGSSMNTNTIVRGIRWAPNGRYFAAAGQAFSNEDFAQIFRFNKEISSISSVLNLNVFNRSGEDVAWSPNGKYLAITTRAPDQDRIYLYSFDPYHASVTELSSAITSANGFTELRSVAWAPNGEKLAIGSALETDSGGRDVTVVQVLTGLSFVSENSICNNIISYVSGSRNNEGFAISGSSTSNMIIGNNAYQVSEGYANIPNVFNPMCNQEPSALSNVLLRQNVPLPTPLDLARSLCHFEYQSQLLVDALL